MIRKYKIKKEIINLLKKYWEQFNNENYYKKVNTTKMAKKTYERLKDVVCIMKFFTKYNNINFAITKDGERFLILDKEVEAAKLLNIPIDVGK